MTISKVLAHEIALSAVFMGLGFAKHAEKATEVMGDHDLSQIDGLAHLAALADRLERFYTYHLTPAHKESFCGVWAYDVAEPFGEWFGSAWANNESTDTRAANKALARILAENLKGLTEAEIYDLLKCY